VHLLSVQKSNNIYFRKPNIPNVTTNNKTSKLPPHNSISHKKRTATGTLGSSIPRTKAHDCAVQERMVSVRPSRNSRVIDASYVRQNLPAFCTPPHNVTISHTDFISAFFIIFPVARNGRLKGVQTPPPAVPTASCAFMQNQ